MLKVNSGCTGRAVAALVAGCAILSLGAPIQAQQSKAEVTWPAVVAPTDGYMEPGPGWPPREVNVTRPLPGKGFKEGYVDVDGWHVHYIEKGKGPVIVSMPGSGGMEFSTAKDILANEFRVIEINPPGWGPDELTPRVRDMKDMAQVFLHVLDKLGVGKFHVLGTSMGCNHAAWVTLLAPDRVLSFTGEGGECMKRGPETARIQTPRAVQAQKDGQAGKGWDDDYDIWAGWPAFQWAPNKWWQTPSFQARLMYRRYVKNFPYNRNQHRDEMIALMKTVKVPATDLVGDRDEVMQTNVSKYWKQSMPQAKFVVVAGATHDIQNSQPEQFVEIFRACALDPSPSRLMCPGD
ncbi:MAG: alpha/beta fold hydrolase [Janthinobacterium lividum]